MQLDHHLEITDEGQIVCRKCGHDLGAADVNFKEHAVCKVRSIRDANPLIVDPEIFIDDKVVFRQYFCPGCATLLENEVILETSPAVWDKQVGSAADRMTVRV
jgi:N-methylhydantoinase B